MKIRARVQSAVVEGDMIRVTATGSEIAASSLDFWPSSTVEFTVRNIAVNARTYRLGRRIWVDVTVGGDGIS